MGTKRFEGNSRSSETANTYILSWLRHQPQHNHNVAMTSAQFSSLTQSCLILCDPIDCSMPGFPITNSWSLFKLLSIEQAMLSNHLILYCSLLLLPSIFPGIRAFPYESVLRIRQPKYWSFSFSISPSNEYLGLISFRIDWFELLAIQGTLNSLLQHQFKTINPSVFSLCYGPILTSIHDYQKNHSFGYMDLCQQSNASTFQQAVQVCHNFSFKE